MAITPLDKDKAMRGSLIDTLDKVNEVITVVNQLSPAAIEQLQQTVAGHTQSISTINNNLGTLGGRVTSVEDVNTTQQSDIDAIKVTLYTPLSAGESPTTNN